MTKKPIQNNSKYRAITDTFGHDLVRVYVRKERGTSTVSLPYFWCEKCNGFYKPEFTKVKFLK